MFVPETSAAALCVALLSMCCWGSWSNSLKVTAGMIRFELFYANFSLAVFLLATVGAFTLGMLQTTGAKGSDTFFDDWKGKSVDRYLLAFAAGLVFNVANLLLCKGIAMLGLALAFPLCIGTALVLGTLLTYSIQPSGNFTLLFLGVVIAFAAVCLAAFVEALKNRQLASVEKAAEVANLAPEAALVAADESTSRQVTAGPSFIRKILVCIIGGILMGLWNPLVTFAEKSPGGISAYCEFFLFTLATLISSLVLLPAILIWPIEGGASTSVLAVVKEYQQVPIKAHLWSIVGGVVWSVGTLSNAVAGISGVLSSAESYAIGQCANMIAIFWGVFFFQEFKGTDWKVMSLLAIVCLLYALAIVCIASSSS